jgi:hypothetical protein
VPCLAWSAQPVKTSIDEVLAFDRQFDGGRGAEKREAAGWLRRELKNGAVAERDLEQRAKEAGLKWSTVRRAKKEMGLRCFREGFGKEGVWYWKSPPAPIDDQLPQHQKLSIYGINDANGNREGTIDAIDGIDEQAIPIDAIDAIDTQDRVTGEVSIYADSPPGEAETDLDAINRKLAEAADQQREEADT